MANNQSRGPYKSADTGKFVTAAYAAKHPKTTYKVGKGSKRK